MSFNKMKPIKGGYGGCLHCGYQYEQLPMNALIAVGFGSATVTKNGRVIYDELWVKDGKFWTTQDAENMAIREPNNDWRIHLIAPLSERHYQRQGKRLWVLYKKGYGFA